MAVRVLTDRQKHTQKDGSDSMTSTADAGGNKFKNMQLAMAESRYQLKKLKVQTKKVRKQMPKV